jgi:hypothetical protein
MYTCMCASDSGAVEEFSSYFASIGGNATQVGDEFLNPTCFLRRSSGFFVIPGLWRARSESEVIANKHKTRKIVWD